MLLLSSGTLYTYIAELERGLDYFNAPERLYRNETKMEMCVFPPSAVILLINIDRNELLWPGGQGRRGGRSVPARGMRTFAFGRLIYATRRGWRTTSPRPMSSHVLLLLMLRLMVLRLPLAFGLCWWSHAILGSVLGGAHLHQEIGRHQTSNAVALAPVKTVVVHLAVDEYGLAHFEV